MFALVRKYGEKRALETCFEWPRSEMRHSRRSRAVKDKVAPYQDNLDQSALKTKGIRPRKFKISHETLTKTGSTKPLAHLWESQVRSIEWKFSIKKKAYFWFRWEYHKAISCQLLRTATTSWLKKKRIFQEKFLNDSVATVVLKTWNSEDKKRIIQ